MTSSTATSEAIANTSTAESSADEQMINTEEKQTNGIDEEANISDTKTGKRKRASKKTTEVTENISNGRPKRTLSKRKITEMYDYPINHSSFR